MSERPVTKLARFALLVALSLILGYIESLLPLPGLPGVKLGLGNIVLLYALYWEGARGALPLMLCKVLLSGLLFGGPAALVYSLAGGVCSLCVMALLKRAGVELVGVSIGGAAAHNIGQLAVAALAVGPRAAAAYLAVLLFSALLTGLVTGLAAKYTLAALKKSEHR